MTTYLSGKIAPMSGWSVELVGPHGFVHGWVKVGMEVQHKDGSRGVVSRYDPTTQTVHADWHLGPRAGKNGGVGTTKAYHVTQHQPSPDHREAQLVAMLSDKDLVASHAAERGPSVRRGLLRQEAARRNLDLQTGRRTAAPPPAPPKAAFEVKYSPEEIARARNAWRNPGPSSIDHTHPRVRAAVTGALEGVHPRVQKNLTSVRVVDYHVRPDIPGATTDAVYESTNGHHGKGTLTVGHHLVLNPEIEKGVIDAEHSGYLAPTGFKSGLDRTVAHELGHHLLDNMADQDKQNMFRAIFSGPGWSHPAPGPDHGISPAQLVRDNRAEITKRVGSYAATDPAEFIAELWAQYRGGSDSALAQLAGEHIEDNSGLTRADKLKRDADILGEVPAPKAPAAKAAVHDWVHAGATVTHKDGSTGRVTGYVRATQTATVDWHGGKRAGKTGTTKAYHLVKPFSGVNPEGKTSTAGRVVPAKPSGPVHNPNQADPFAAFETNSKPPPAPKIEQVLGDPVTNRRPKLAEEKLVTDHLNGLIARHGVGGYGAPPSVSVRDLNRTQGSNAESAKNGVVARYHRNLHLIEIDHRQLVGPDSVPTGRFRKRGYFSAAGDASSAQHALTHEFGHSLDQHLTPDRRAQMMREVAAAIPGASPKTMDPAAWVQANKEHVINHVSTYASADDRELIAELFAEFEHSRNPSPAARVVGRYLSKSGGAR